MKRFGSVAVVILLLLVWSACAETYTISEISAEIDVPSNWGIITKSTKKSEVPENFAFLIDELKTRPGTHGFIYYNNIENFDILVAQLVVVTDNQLKNQTGISKSDYKEAAEALGKAFKDSGKFDGNVEEKLIEGKDVNFVRMSGKMEGFDTAVYITVVNGIGFGATAQYFKENTLLAFENILTNMDVLEYEKGTDNEPIRKATFWDRFLDYFIRHLSWQAVSFGIIIIAVVFVGIGSVIKFIFKRKRD